MIAAYVHTPSFGQETDSAMPDAQGYIAIESVVQLQRQSSAIDSGRCRYLGTGKARAYGGSKPEKRGKKCERPGSKHYTHIDVFAGGRKGPPQAQHQHS